MMGTVEAIIGRAVADLVGAEFLKAPVASGAPGVRINGFNEEEIRHLVERLLQIDLTLAGDDEPVRIVVGSREQLSGIPPELVLQPGWTLTRHRNENDHGLIVIEHDPQLDETGIRAMHTLSDSDLLNQPDWGTVSGRLHEVARISWSEAEPDNPLALPEPLLEVLKDVFAHLARVRRPSLRTWVAYNSAVTERLVLLHRAVAGPEVRQVAAEELAHLNLFPDPDLFERSTRVGRRLERNVFMSEMRTPQGRSVRDEHLGATIDIVELVGPDGSPPRPEEMDELRRTMRNVLDAGGPDSANNVAYRIWEQLFERRRATVGLGTQIRAHLEEHHPLRVQEYEDLIVQDALDDGDDAAALQLLRNEPTAAELPLVDCIKPVLRKKLDRLAFQGERVEPDPLIAVLYGLNALEPEHDAISGRIVTLEWEHASHGATRSAQLFAFLYRQLLEDVAETCDGSVGTRFEIHDSIRSIPSIEALFVEATEPENEEEDADERAEREWAPLRFRLSLSDTNTPLIRFRWDPRAVPGMAAFAVLVGNGGAPTALAISTLDEWCNRWFEAPWGELALPVPEAADELVRMWTELSHEHFRAWKRAGLSVAGLDEYLDAWAPLLQGASERYVPHGGPLPPLDEFLDRDTAITSDHRFVMLGTHPLRLRWLRHHLANLGTYIQQALFGELQLNPDNDGVFFRWLERVSPHRQPPVMSSGSQQLATAVRELQMHEEFALIPTGEDAPDWLGALDDASIAELVATSRSYVMAFPHKIGGLSVLLMATSGAASTARRFVDQLRQGDLASLDLELHIATTALEHDEVAAAFASLDSDDGRDRRLLPSFRLQLHDWIGYIPEAFAELEGRIDLALAPNLFGLHSRALEETRRSDAGISGRFDPWVDPTTHTRPTENQTINVSHVLLPATPDPMLENWSTLTVRRRRQAPVAAEDPGSTDFVTLQVAFDKNEALFNRLHELAHWVVTLDPFVGRDQIDALHNAPDVIIVKSDVGKNKSNTLVVSSAAGKEWITRQLASRLRDEFDVEPDRARRIAKRLYEIGRHVVPGLMLRAVGLGRATEEILGLILARYAVDQFSLERPAGDGREYWLSLDEHTDWFGGPNRMRPDLLRVRLRRTGADTHLNLLVLESKFRQRFDLGAADEQVAGGVKLFDSAFQPMDSSLDDARFWRLELLTALTQLSHRLAGSADLPALQAFGSEVDERSLLEDLRAGIYHFDRTEAIVCSTGWADDPGPGSPIGVSPRGHRLLRLGRSTVLELLDRIERDLAPGEPDASAPTELRTVTPSPGVEGARPDAESTPAEVEVPSELQSVVVSIGGAEASTGSGDAAPSAPRAERGLQHAHLESRYSRLLAKLDQLGVAVDRPEGQAFKEGPGFCLYRIVPRPGVSADRVTGKVDDIKLALELPAELNIRSYLDKGAVVFEVPKEDPDRYFVTAEDLWDRSSDRNDALCVPLGEDIEGAVVELDFSSPDTPHLLIAGQTGSGKSIALATILSGLCRRKDPSQLQLLLVDPKSTELIDLADDPHVLGQIGWMAEDAIEMLACAVTEMNRRYHLFRAQKARSLPEYNAAVAREDGIPWWMMVLDEYADLTSDPDDRKAIEADLKRIAQKGRAAGIHLIVATQKPSAEVISTVIRSNLPSQLALRVKSATDSRIILEEAGAESLAGKGDAFLRTTRGLQRVQCAKVSRPE